MATKLIATILLLSLLLASPLGATCCSTPTPSPKVPAAPATPTTPVMGHCPNNSLKLAVCADVLGLVHAVIGDPPSGTTPCCALINGLADLEAAACLCTAIKANVLGLNLNVPITLSLILSACQKTVPPQFKCQ